MVIEYKKYDKYKDSGVEWLGEIPDHWDLKSNKYIFRINKSLVGKKSSDYDLLSLTLKGIIKRDMENPEGKFPAEFDTYQEVHTGDFVFCMFDVEETPRTIGLSQFSGMITGAYTVLKPIININRNYFYYFYLNIDMQKKLKPLYRGLRNTIPKESFFGFKSYFPPISEQTAIANFLDDKCEKIDKAISQKEKLIELLKERKQILIQNAVTKGLDLDVKMKDSGVDWIGEIPDHWQIKKLKYVSKDYMYGTSVDCNEFDSGIPVLRIPNIDEIQFNFDNLKYARLSKDEVHRYKLEYNDILIVRTNGNPKLVGKSAIFNSSEDFLFASYLIRLKPLDNINSLFLIESLNSFSIRGALTHSSRTTVGNYNLNTKSLGDCFMAYPPQNEQEKIFNFIQNQRKKIKSAISKMNTQIEKLKEYKSTLIDSAVTGKIKVV